MSWNDLALITSTNSSKYIKVDDRKGTIEIGKDADFTIINEGVDLIATVVGGEVLYKGKERL